MKAEPLVFEVTVEGADTAIVMALLIEYFAYQSRLAEYKQQRREMHETGKCSGEGNCLTDFEGEFMKAPDLSTTCDFCTKRHALYLLIKSSSSKSRGIMQKIKRQIIKMPYFQKLISNNNEQE